MALTRKSKMKRLTFVTLSMVLLWSLHREATADNLIFPASPSAPEKVIQVRGEESIVQELNMGPGVTEFWRKVQILIANREDIQDFSKLVKLLGLTITDPIDAVTPKKPGLQGLHSIKTESYGNIVESIGYGISRDVYDPNKRVIGFRLELFSQNSCISSEEVRRIYGKGLIGTSVHDMVKPDSGPDTAGYSFSESYGEELSNVRRSPLVFNYHQNGCLWRISLSQPVAEHHSISKE